MKGDQCLVGVGGVTVHVAGAGHDMATFPGAIIHDQSVL